MRDVERNQIPVSLQDGSVGKMGFPVNFRFTIPEGAVRCEGEGSYAQYYDAEDNCLGHGNVEVIFDTRLDS